MQNIDIKGKKWVIDLDWEILPNEGSIKQEAKEAAERTNKTYGVTIEHDGQVAIGLAKKPSKYPSASYFLALANQESLSSGDSYSGQPDWIVIEEMGDDKFWMAVINAGIPSPTYDKVYDITTIKDKIIELLISERYQIFSQAGEIHSMLDGIKYVENKNVNDLTENIKAKVKYVKYRGIPTGLLIGCASVMTLLIAGVLVNTFLDDYNFQKRMEQQAFQQAEEARLAQEGYQKRLAEYNAQIENMRQQAIDGVVLGLSGNPNKVLNAWYDSIGGLEFGTHGWEMNQIDCSFNPLIIMKSNCVLNFARTGLSTNRMLLEDYPDAVINGDKASVTRVVLANDDIFKKPSNDILNTLPDAKNWGFDMISQLQLLKIVGIDYSVNPSSDIVFTPPQKPLSPQEIATGTTAPSPAPISIGIAQGELTIRSDNFDLLRELASNVDLMAVGVKNVSFKLQNLGSIGWEVTLNYYIKNSGGTISGSDSKSLSNLSVPQTELQERNR